MREVMLVAGPELDAKVAEACGVAGKIDYVSPEYGSGHYAFCVGVDEWSLSTDLNAAFEAAENVGLFCGRALVRDNDGWAVVDCDSEWSEPGHVSLERFCDSQATPALAICAALLALRPAQSS